MSACHQGDTCVNKCRHDVSSMQDVVVIVRERLEATVGGNQILRAFSDAHRLSAFVTITRANSSVEISANDSS